MSAQPADVPQAYGSFRSVADLWNHRVSSTPDLVAMLSRDRGRWVETTWREADVRVRAIANGLLAFGLQPEQRCAVMGATSVPWILADFGIVCAAGATTTIHPSETDDTIAHILSNADVRVAFVDDAATAERMLVHADALPSLQRVVVLKGATGDDSRVVSLDALEAEGRAFAEAQPKALAEAQAAITPSQLATLIYTSGTTGLPKGVELTHDAWVYEAEAIDRLGVIGPDDLQLLFLPLAHVFAKVMQVAFVRLGVPTAVDGTLERFVDNVGTVRPTWMAAVPRVFEKAHRRIAERWRERGPVAWKAFRWAADVGIEVSRLRHAGRRVPPHLLVQHRLADELLFKRVRDAFGGRLRFVISGGAPLPLEVAQFFDACGIPVCEGYGLTESAAASCVNTPDDIVLGTVGKPLPGCQVKVGRDGELLIKSRGVMRGYHDLPDATAEALDDDGWLHTGDLGQILASGHVRITGRKKDLLVTAGGKNVAPAHAQALLVGASPLIAHALLHGDRRNFCSALIDLEPEAVKTWTEAAGIELPDHAARCAHPAVKAAIQQAVDDANRALASYEQVRKFAIVPAPFTVEDGTLTPTLKVKRGAVEARYADVLDGFYEGTVTRY